MNQITQPLEYVEYLFPVLEIEEIIIGYLDILRDGMNLLLVNKYMHDVIQNNPVFMEIEEFYRKKSSIAVYIDVGHSTVLKNFLKACFKGYIHTAKYLYQKYFDEIDIHYMNEIAFQYSCAGGNLELSKWLYNSDPEKKINIHIDNDLAFQWSCENGHLKVAKWLYQLGSNKLDSNEETNVIDIRADGDYAFKQCCAHNHRDVAEWLVSICDEYSFTSQGWQLRYFIKKN